MTDTSVEHQEPRPPSGRDTAELVRAGVRGLGQTLITAGFVLLLFVVYEVWVSNIFADQAQSKVHKQFAAAVKAGKDPLQGVDKLSLPAGQQVVIPAGAGFANLYIPRFGKDYAETIVQGTNAEDLNKGPGHYDGSAVPGQIGDFAVAGHRVGQGEPFLNLDQLRAGDPIVVQTGANWYVYRVMGNQSTDNLAQLDSQGIPGREIVSPNAVQVIAPVPDHVGEVPTRALMTMTTCNPKYSANQRMIVHAVLVRSVPASGSATPRELPGGTL
jgi:sortase A